MAGGRPIHLYWGRSGDVYYEGHALYLGDRIARRAQEDRFSY